MRILVRQVDTSQGYAKQEESKTEHSAYVHVLHEAAKDRGEELLYNLLAGGSCRQHGLTPGSDESEFFLHMSHANAHLQITTLLISSIKTMLGGTHAPRTRK